MPVWLSPWEWTAADWAGLQFVVLVIAALVALRQVNEARRVREERARPFVVIDLEVFQTIAQFKITNLGSTIARSVRFSFEPPLQSSGDSVEGVTPLAETNLFKVGIPSLAPGKEVVALFDQLPDRLSKGLPDDYEVTVSYDDASGKRFSETMTVGYSFLKEVGRIHRRDIHDVHRELERLYREVRKWTVLGSAVRVMRPDDVSASMEEREEELRQRREAQAARDEVERLGATGMTPTSPAEEDHGGASPSQG
jgi:hypothetical protein